MTDNERKAMEAMEMLNQFELLYNNIASNQAPGLNPYEISLILTKAQKEIMKNYFNPKGNKYQEGYDESAKRHSDFASLLCDEILEPYETASYKRLDYRSILYKIPESVFLLLNEQLEEWLNVQDASTSGSSPITVAPSESTGGKRAGIYTVVPIDYDEYTRLMQKPYKYPPKNQFWKLDTGYDDNDRSPIVEVIGRRRDKSTYRYHIRYIKNPEPIVLVNLADIAEGLSIEGVSTVNPCKLPKHLHDEIIQRAVEIAKGMWQGDLSSTIQLGQRSE